MAQEVSQLNVDLTCDGKCEGCEKFFDCVLPKKNSFLLTPIMDKVRERLGGIKHKIISVGGKGGVGKTLVAANLAVALAMMGRKVTVLDQVFDAPCIPRMLGVEKQGMKTSKDGLLPGEALLGIHVVSMGLILPEDEVLTWFHGMKRSATEELLTTVVYGERDYLIVDVPAGTSSDTMNAMQLIPNLSGGTIVTVPSKVSEAVAYKAAVLLQKAKVPIFGIFENMATFSCEYCDEKVDLIGTGGGERLAGDVNIPFFGSVPMDRRVAECSDKGVPVVYKYPDSKAGAVFMAAAKKIDETLNAKGL